MCYTPGVLGLNLEQKQMKYTYLGSFKVSQLRRNYFFHTHFAADTHKRKKYVLWLTLTCFGLEGRYSSVFPR